MTSHQVSKTALKTQVTCFTVLLIGGHVTTSDWPLLPSEQLLASWRALVPIHLYVYIAVSSADDTGDFVIWSKMSSSKNNTHYVQFLITLNLTFLLYTIQLLTKHEFTVLTCTSLVKLMLQVSCKSSWSWRNIPYIEDQCERSHASGIALKCKGSLALHFYNISCI